MTGSQYPQRPALNSSQNKDFLGHLGSKIRTGNPQPRKETAVTKAGEGETRPWRNITPPPYKRMRKKTKGRQAQRKT